MIKTLRKKFIVSAMIAITALIVLMLVALNVFTLISTNKQVDERLELLARYGGESSNIQVAGFNPSTIPEEFVPDDLEIPDMSGEENQGMPEEGAQNMPGGEIQDVPGEENQNMPEEDAQDVSENEIQALPEEGTPEPDETSDIAAAPSGEPRDMQAGEAPETGNVSEMEEKPTDNFNPSVMENFQNQSITDERSDADTFLTSAFFVVRFSADGQVTYVDVSKTSAIEEDDAEEVAIEIYAEGTSAGRIGVYQYLLSENEYEEGSTMVFLDITESIQSILRVLLISLGVGVVGWLLMLGLVILLSKKVLQPVAENIERQKQFVTNAGHELKTPLAIIQSNTEALELFNGESKYTSNIKAQVSRLSYLTKNLLQMSKMEESQNVVAKETFCLSDAVNETLQTFKGLFEQKGVTITEKITPEVMTFGDSHMIRELLGILFDNAAKYVNKDGSACVTVDSESKHSVFIIENTCDKLPSAPPDKLFERFYRSDESHSQQTEGQGIGLSVALGIVQSHGGTILANYVGENTIRFIVTL